MADTPDDLAKALKKNGLAEFFADCTESHRREYLKWISEAKRPETREARIKKAMVYIAAKQAEENARLKKKRV
jgi:uncharacterized protein YdeI (YjbR/CyaY-like superfamily)